MLLNYQKGLSLQWRLYRQTGPLLNNRKGEGGICLFRGYEEKSMANDYSIWERGDAEKMACAQLWQLANYCNYVLTCVGLLSPISKGTENTNAWKQNFHYFYMCLLYLYQYFRCWNLFTSVCWNLFTSVHCTVHSCSYRISHVVFFAFNSKKIATVFWVFLLNLIQYVAFNPNFCI